MKSFLVASRIRTQIVGIEGKDTDRYTTTSVAIFGAAIYFNSWPTLAQKSSFGSLGQLFLVAHCI